MKYDISRVDLRRMMNVYEDTIKKWKTNNFIISSIYKQKIITLECLIVNYTSVIFSIEYIYSCFFKQFLYYFLF